MQVVACGKHQLAAEHVTLQFRREIGRIGIRQQQPQRLGIPFQQGEQGDHPAFRGQPAVPLPVADGQGGHLVHELRLGEGGRIAAGDG